MEAYLINQLERMTGIKAHTIRIWEKRYGIIEPARSDTNRRYYSEGQVRKLLNVSTLLSHGHKISKIATLSEEELNEQIEEYAAKDEFDSASTGYINDLTKSMLTFDEAAFEKIFSAATLRFGIYDAMMKVIYPFLEKIGILWRVNKTSPVQEHFASNIIKRKLMVVIDGLMPATSREKIFVLFLPPGELHELGLLFADYILRSHGYHTIYLGQDVPVENVKRIVEQVHPAYLLCFYIIAIPKEVVQQQVEVYSKMKKGLKILVAGNIDLFPAGKPKSGNITYLKEVPDLLACI